MNLPTLEPGEKRSFPIAGTPARLDFERSADGAWLRVAVYRSGARVGEDVYMPLAELPLFCLHLVKEMRGRLARGR